MFFVKSSQRVFVLGMAMQKTKKGTKGVLWHLSLLPGKGQQCSRYNCLHCLQAYCVLNYLCQKTLLSSATWRKHQNILNVVTSSIIRFDCGSSIRFAVRKIKCFFFHNPMVQFHNQLQWGALVTVAFLKLQHFLQQFYHISKWLNELYKGHLA